MVHRGLCASKRLPDPEAAASTLNGEYVPTPVEINAVVPNEHRLFLRVVWSIISPCPTWRPRLLRESSGRWSPCIMSRLSGNGVPDRAMIPVPCDRQIMVEQSSHSHDIVALRHPLSLGDSTMVAGTGAI